MREARFSLYSLLMLLFGYMLVLTLYNLSWSAGQAPVGRLEALRQRAVVEPRRERAKEKDHVEHLRSASADDDVVSEDGREDESVAQDGVWSPSEETWDLQQLLDFAVVDLDETIADKVTDWLSQHPQIHILSTAEEDHSETAGDPYRLVDEMIEATSRENMMVRGYRVDLEQDDEFDALRLYWPKTKLVVVLRHPVWWFEDYYNRYIQTSTTPLLAPNRLIGSCQRLGQTVCTAKADVAFSLLKLGKTMNNPTPRTLEILKENRRRESLSKIPLHPNPVFLVAWEQLTDSDHRRQEQLVQDLEYFLGVRSEIPFLPLPLDQTTWLEEHQHKDPHVPRIHICENSHRPLRRALMEISQRSAQWIRDDFLTTSTVTCSQMESFSQILESWMADPCDHDATHR
jgi:hypothetical protein